MFFNVNVKQRIINNKLYIEHNRLNYTYFKGKVNLGLEKSGTKNS